jgi:SnoaL-like domain
MTDLARAVLAIDNLIGRYAYVSDHGFVAADYESLWAEDAELIIGDAAPSVGRAAVLDVLSGLSATVPFAFHQFSRETLEFTADLSRATGTWSVFVTNTTIAPDGPTPMVAVGRYQCELVAADDGWLLRRITMHFDHISSWHQSWVLRD